MARRRLPPHAWPSPEHLYTRDDLPYNLRLFGGIAQLGERLHGMQEVSGSIPLTSTKENAVTINLRIDLRENWY